MAIRNKIKKRAGNKNFLTGFTLLEMIVALGVFSVVIVTFSSSLLSLIDAERKVAGIATLQDNLRFALEVMAKEIRTGTSYQVTQGGASFTFLNADDPPKDIIYRLNINCRLEGYRCIEKSFDGGFTFLSLTSKQVSVDGLQFEILGDRQPLVLITIQAKVETKNIISKLNLQTAVSQRKLNL